MRAVAPLRLDRVARTVGAGDRAESLARARLEALGAVEHPGVCRPLDVVREDDAVVVLSPRVAGVPLDAAPPVEELGAWVWLVAGLAEALSALHARGLAHGDVSGGNVIVGARPVLVDLVGPAVSEERGTPGCVAPERADGAPPASASDVYAMGAVCLAAAGEPIRTVARSWMLPLLDPDDRARPSAAAVAAGIHRCAPPARWMPGVDAADQARRSAGATRTQRDPAAWHWRLRRRPWALAATAIAAAAVAIGISGAPPIPVAAPPAAPASSIAAAPGASADMAAGASADMAAGGPIAGPSAWPTAGAIPDPALAASDLTRERIDALMRGDGERLVGMTVPGSAAWAVASREARLVGDGARFSGLDVEVGEARIVASGSADAVVEVGYALSAHARVDPDGSRTAFPAQRQRVLLSLAWNGERWRVAEAGAAPVSATS